MGIQLPFVSLSKNIITMIALKVLTTFCLATICLASPATYTNEKQIEILKDTITKLSESIPEVDTKLDELGWKPTGEKEMFEEPQGKCCGRGTRCGPFGCVSVCLPCPCGPWGCGK